MSGLIEVDCESMETSVDTLRLLADDMQHELDLLTRLLDVLSSQWSGEAYNAYRTAQTDWNETMGATKAMLDQAANLLAQAIDSYEETESSVLRECT